MLYRRIAHILVKIVKRMYANQKSQPSFFLSAICVCIEGMLCQKIKYNVKPANIPSILKSADREISSIQISKALKGGVRPRTQPPNNNKV